MQYSITCPHCGKGYPLDRQMLGNNLLCTCKAKFYYDKSLPRTLFVKTSDGIRRMHIFDLKSLIQSGTLASGLRVLSTDKQSWRSFDEIHADAKLECVILNTPFTDEAFPDDAVDASAIPTGRQTSIPMRKRFIILLILIPNLLLYYGILSYVYSRCMPETIQKFFH